ncbi:hypothetical protein [Burkholderia plantarii]|uniref:hypothetical protein n=2 Tax=Burkholderia plantarii TaxID=41899 RepID=UPI0006D88984|nr:hypothetical protein [Burkholderia plantarii]ALK30584.1 hypothetical protein bpln_1g17870 [Burkholderia plantarii]
MFMNEWFLRRALAMACARPIGSADPTGRPQVIAHLAARAGHARRLLVTGLDGDRVTGLGGEAAAGEAAPVSMTIDELDRRRVSYVVYLRRYMFHEREAWRVVLGVRLHGYRLAAWLGDLRMRGFWHANAPRAARMEVLGRIAALSAELSSQVAPAALLALADWPQVPRDAAVDERRRFLDRTMATLVAAGYVRKTATGGFEVSPRGEEALERYDADRQRYCHQSALRHALNVLVVVAGIAALEAGGTARAPSRPADGGLGAVRSCVPADGDDDGGSDGNGCGRFFSEGPSTIAPAPYTLDTARRLPPSAGIEPFGAGRHGSRKGARPAASWPRVAPSGATGPGGHRLAAGQQSA